MTTLQFIENTRTLNRFQAVYSVVLNNLSKDVRQKLSEIVINKEKMPDWVYSEIFDSIYNVFKVNRHLSKEKFSELVKTFFSREHLQCSLADAVNSFHNISSTPGDFTSIPGDLSECCPNISSYPNTLITCQSIRKDESVKITFNALGEFINDNVKFFANGIFSIIDTLINSAQDSGNSTQDLGNSTQGFGNSTQFAYVNNESNDTIDQIKEFMNPMVFCGISFFGMLVFGGLYVHNKCYSNKSKQNNEPIFDYVSFGTKTNIDTVKSVESSHIPGCHTSV